LSWGMVCHTTVSVGPKIIIPLVLIHAAVKWRVAAAVELFVGVMVIFVEHVST